MKSKHWIIGLLIALAICLAFLLWPDKQHDSHNDQHVDVIADHDTLKAHGADYARINDSLIKSNHRLDSANKSLVKGQATTERKLNAKTAEVKTYLAQIREINQDTGVFGHMLDSLNEKVESLTFLIAQYEQHADSINNVNDSLKIGYEGLIKEKDKRIAELQATYDKLYTEYIKLDASNYVMQKDLKRQKLKTKVAAVLGGVLSLLALIK